MTATLTAPVKLPAWRLVTGLAVLGSLVAVLIMLAPVYIDNYRLDRYMRALAAQPASSAAPDADLIGNILAHARQLDLPVRRDDIQISHENGRAHIHVRKYVVQMNLVLYQVDLHFSEAASR